MDSRALVDTEKVRENLEKQINGLSRGPFRDVLAHFIEAEPELEDIIEYAKNNPDRWARSVVELARAAGYADKRVEDHNINLNLDNVSDAQLMMMLGKNMRQLKDITEDTELLEVLSGGNGSRDSQVFGEGEGDRHGGSEEGATTLPEDTQGFRTVGDDVPGEVYVPGSEVGGEGR